MPTKVICLRVPLRSWIRLRTARMSTKIVHHALQIRERHEMNKLSEVDSSDQERDHLINRITRIENTLKTMESTLKAISSKLTLDKVKRKTKKKKRRRSKARKSSKTE